MLKEKVRGCVEKIQAIEGIAGCALISRDGIMLGKAMQGDFNEPWFAAMNATLYASAESAAGILKIPPPEAVSFSSGGTTILVTGAGDRLLVVAVLQAGSDARAVQSRLQSVAGEIGGSF
jgi:hypothetical protein